VTLAQLMELTSPVSRWSEGSRPWRPIANISPVFLDTRLLG
jgi:hypothetical protein